MLEVSEKASEVIKKQFLEGHEGPQPIRILMTEGGWRGPYFVMAFDEPRENDHVFTEKGVTFLIEKTLVDSAKLINIDYVEGPLGSGFTLKSELTKGEGGSIKCETICGHC
jgi:Fe-S cluster assembly iron-binding protein IscA